MRYAFAVLFAVLQTTSQQPPAKEQSKRPDSTQQHAKAQPPASPRPSPQPDTGKGRTQARREQPEPPFLTFSLTDVVVAIFTIVLAVVAILQRQTMEAQRAVMDAQKGEMEKQRTTMESQLTSMQAQETQLRASVVAANKSADAAILSQRPWLKVEQAVPTGPPRTDREGIHVTLRIGLRNTGNTPAMNVRSMMKLDLRASETRVTPPGEKLPKLFSHAIRGAESDLDAWAAGAETQGHVIFPGDSLSVDWTTTVNPDQIAAARPGSGMPLFLSLGYCVRYDFVGGQGATAFGRLVMKRNGMNWDIPLDPPRNVDADFVASPYEDYAY